eukprot:1552158-Pyramimonas_sp.AAC.1
MVAVVIVVISGDSHDTSNLRRTIDNTSSQSSRYTGSKKNISSSSRSTGSKHNNSGDRSVGKRSSMVVVVAAAAAAAAA